MKAPWLHIATDELLHFVKELPGPETHPRIALYLRCVGMPSDDSISWCAGFVNYCLIEGGENPPRKPNARSMLSWGAPCGAVPGAVVVFWRESPSSWKGHTAFLLGTGKTSAYVLGGNQDNKVCVAAYPLTSVLGYRLPKNWEIT